MTGPVGDDAFRSYDAAYVLGALTPAERHEYEQHLVGCRRCREAVRSFAGLPGLMSRVRPEDFTTDEVQPPPDLLPSLLSAATRRRRRGR
ncbi:MAG: zf-HC2 domain-containing protein, partial [Actinocatenispora sp.]